MTKIMWNGKEFKPDPKQVVDLRKAKSVFDQGIRVEMVTLTHDDDGKWRDQNGDVWEEKTLLPHHEHKWETYNPVTGMWECWCGDARYDDEDGKP